MVEKKKASKLKVNILALLVYLIVVAVVIGINLLIFSNTNQSNDGWSDLILFAQNIFFSGIAVMIYSILLPLFISMEEKYWSNFIKYISVIICDLLACIFVIVVFKNLKLAMIFIAIIIIGMIITSFLKFSLVSSKKKEIE